MTTAAAAYDENVDNTTKFTFQWIPVMLNTFTPLQWSHNERDGVSNHRRLHRLLDRLFRRWSKKTSKLSITGLCERNLPVTGGFPSQSASNAESVSIWWRHHADGKITRELSRMSQWLSIMNSAPFFTRKRLEIEVSMFSVHKQTSMSTQ